MGVWSFTSHFDTTAFWIVRCQSCASETCIDVSEIMRLIEESRIPWTASENPISSIYLFDLFNAIWSLFR
jgi:hypothetical protein